MFCQYLHHIDEVLFGNIKIVWILEKFDLTAVVQELFVKGRQFRAVK